MIIIRLTNLQEVLKLRVVHERYTSRDDGSEGMNETGDRMKNKDETWKTARHQRWTLTIFDETQARLQGHLAEAETSSTPNT